MKKVSCSKTQNSFFADHFRFQAKSQLVLTKITQLVSHVLSSFLFYQELRPFKTYRTFRFNFPDKKLISLRGFTISPFECRWFLKICANEIQTLSSRRTVIPKNVWGGWCATITFLPILIFTFVISVAQNTFVVAAFQYITTRFLIRASYFHWSIFIDLKFRKLWYLRLNSRLFLRRELYS